MRTCEPAVAFPFFLAGWERVEREETLLKLDIRGEFSYFVAVWWVRTVHKYIAVVYFAGFFIQLSYKCSVKGGRIYYGGWLAAGTTYSTQNQ